jgi:DNA-binding beta-propeller fold protein YncE
MNTFKKKVTLISLSIFASNATFNHALAEGFPNVEQVPGTLLAGPVAPEMGRLAIMEYLGGKVVTIPEKPSSPRGSDFIVRSWDLADPSNPVEVGTHGVTFQPFRAHGTIKSNNQVFIGGYPDNALESNGDAPLTKTPWVGPDGHWESSSMYRPWTARAYWSYDSPAGNSWLQLDGEQTASWDHLGQTGVIGFPHFIGNLMIYASDQSNSGMASYDVSDPSNPVLLDVLKDDNVGGYWNEIWSHYIVFAQRKPSGRIVVVDFSDPSNLRKTCDVPVDGEGNSPMYANFQDGYAFTGQWKFDIEACEVVLEFDTNNPRPTRLDQFALPLGNLVVFGGNGRWDQSANTAGMTVWAHQAEPDTLGPYVTYHIPRSDQTNYPVIAPITVLIPETLQTETLVANETVILREVGGSNVSFEYVLSHAGTLTIDPDGHLEPNTTYEVVFVENGVRDAANNGMQGYSFRFSTGSAVDTTPTPTPTPGPAPTPTPTPTPAPINALPVISSITTDTGSTVESGTLVTFSVDASDEDEDSLEYRFNLADGAGYSEWSTSSSASQSYSTPDLYRVNVQVRDGNGGQVLGSTTITVLASIVDEPGDGESQNRYLTSSQLACDIDGDSLWAANPDNDTLANLNSDLSNLTEVSTEGQPQSVVVVDELDQVWVTQVRGDSVSIYSRDGSSVGRVDFDYGDAPQGMVLSPDQSSAYVALYGSGEIVKIDTHTRNITGRLELGPTPYALALSPDGNKLLVTRFISDPNWGEVWHVNPSDMSLRETIVLKKDSGNDTLESGRGIPNYLAAIAFSPDGERAYVVGKKDNTDRSPILWSGISSSNDLDDDNTVRTVMSTIEFDGNNGTDNYSLRIDFDNADSPSALAQSPNGEYLFVALQGNNAVHIFNMISHGVNGGVGTVLTHLNTGLAPQGLCLNSDNNVLYSKNFTERSITSFDLSDLFNTGRLTIPSQEAATVSAEALDEEVLLGKQIFYNAADERMSAEGYISCATCHIDGGHDGRTWDFTGRGEGLRNTPTLNGKLGTRYGNVHWSANFDEIQDFEHDIRNAFLGAGFLNDEDFEGATTLGTSKAGQSEDLDALATYVSSLGEHSIPRSPFRTPSGEMTAQGASGRAVFESLECDTCHTNEGFTDSLVHDVGSLRSYSGQRLGEILPGIKTPSLLGIFATAPYMHDGSAATLEDVFTTVGGNVYQAEDASNSNPGPVRGHEYLRGSNGSSIHGDGESTLTFSNVDGGSGGLAYLRFHYSGVDASERTVEITVNGDSENRAQVQLEYLPSDGLIRRNHLETPAVAVTLDAGSSNSIALTYPGGSGFDITIDDLTVSNSDHIEAASAHTSAMSVSASNFASLVHYLKQIDGQNAPEDNDSGGSGEPIGDGNGDGNGGSEPDQPPSLPTPEPEPEPTPDSEPDNGGGNAGADNAGDTPGLLPGSDSGGGGSTGWLMALLLIAGLSLRRKKISLN